MSALREACRRRGVAIREHTPVRAIRPRASSVELVAGNETIESRSAVLAAGAWAGAIPVEGVEIPASFPVKGHLVGFDVPAGTLGPILRHGHTYLMQRSSGFTVAGTSSEAGNFDRCVDQATALDIVFRARDLAPGLPLGRPVRSWVGFRPGVEAEGPQVRRIEGSNVWLAYGHYRNGILLAPVTARMVAGAIATDLV
jgi:glycine oxidase